MKKIGTLNRHLSRLIASMGHTDRLVICDSGLPIPWRREVVDLALTPGVPRFLDVLRVVLEELAVERVVIAEEMRLHNTACYEGLRGLLPGVELQQVPHEVFKRLAGEGGNIAFVRSGEATPYANVMLTAGVTFD